MSLRVLRPLAVAAVMGVGAWAAMEAWAPSGRVFTLIALAIVSGVGVAAYVGVLKLLGGLPPRGPEPARVGR